jgi:hypothetical protein
LGTIGAVFRAAAGLNAQERAALDIGDVMMPPMRLRGAKNQLGQRKIVNGLEFFQRFHALDFISIGCVSRTLPLIPDIRLPASVVEVRVEKAGENQ